VFKLIFALLGFFVFGFFGSLIGYFLGSIIDRSRAYGIGGINPLSSGIRQKIFLKTVFILLGKLAKADGHISKEEIAHVENLFQRLGMSTEHKQNAITQFKQGAKQDFDIEPIIEEFMSICGRTHQLRQMLLVYLIVMALSDGTIKSPEERLLIHIAYQLGYDEIAFRQLLDMVLNQSHFAGGSQAVSATAVEDAYKALGVDKNMTDQEIKRAYRKLMSQYHPDKLMGQGLPEDMINVATEQAKEVQVAYDLIVKSRKEQI
tara:strand:- start:2417 stop:3199 length:783 start_codon:yes stop_codon:yes gene_type:complete